MTAQEVYALVERLESKIDGSFVRNDRFAPVERIVYGAVGLILIAVVGAIITMVVGQKEQATIPDVIRYESRRNDK